MLRNQRPQKGSTFTQPIEDFLAEREPIGTGTYAEILVSPKDKHSTKRLNGLICHLILNRKHV